MVIGQNPLHKYIIYLIAITMSVYMLFATNYIGGRKYDSTVQDCVA